METDAGAHLGAVNTLRRDIGYIIGLLNLTQEAVVCIDEKFDIVVFNQGASQMFGYQPEEVIGRPLDLLVPERFRETSKADVLSLGSSGKSLRDLESNSSIIGIRKNGLEFPAEATLSKFSYGGESTFTVVIRDISERVTLDEKLCHAAERDKLTDLPNRVLFQDRVEMAIARASRTGDPFVLGLVDFKEFRLVSATRGQGVGYLVLKGIGDRLRKRLRGCDTIARIGVKQFGIILEGVETPAAALAVAHNLEDSFIDPLVIDGIHETASLTIGMSLYPEHGDTVITLLERAKLAKDQVKQDGAKSMVYGFTPPRNDEVAAQAKV